MAVKNRPAPQRPAITTLMPGTDAPGSKRMTMGEFIIEQVKAGVDPINAAGAVGAMPDELRAWMREGALVFAALQGGKKWERDFTPEQQDCALFADQMVRAHAQHISRLAIVAEQVARGTLPDRVKTVTKTVAGAVVERTTTTEKVMPDPDMLKWKLTVLEPTVYGARATLNVNVTDLTDTEAIADVVAARMAAVAAQMSAERAAAIDATATEVPASDT